MILQAALLLLIGAPQDAGHDYDKWFQSLQQPQAHVSCCSVADCRIVQAKIGQDGYEALVDDKWVPIPDDKILHTANPTGRAVMCWTPYTGVLCFVAPSEV